MKADAPKKVYLQEPTKVRTEKKYDNDVEYTRTDAFIEKACEYLNNTCRRFILTEKDIEDFINYMKGE